MPIFKKRQAAEKQPPRALKGMLCPDCLQPTLHVADVASGIFGIPHYYCTNCGYKGSLYVDPTGNDEQENKALKWLAEEFPEDVIETKSAKELACLSLETKWIPDQSKNTKTLHEWCPFCADVQVNCAICKCPPYICSNHAHGGLIGQLNERYPGDTLLKDVDPVIYAKIVEGFKKLCEGEE